MNISAAKTYIELLVLSRSMANGKKMYEFQKRCLDGIYICLRGDYIQDPETGKMMGSRPSEKVDKSGDSGIIKVGSDKAMISSIDSPIEQKHTGKGNPNAILTYDVPLNNRQQALLDTLPDYDSRITVDRKSVNMADLSALTAKTGDEFAMFTKGNERLIIRGDNRKVNIGIDEAKNLARQGYKWSGHTHPGDSLHCLEASEGDWLVFECFEQNSMVIYNSKGQYRRFDKE